MTEKNILEVRKLTIKYKSSTKTTLALNDVSFAVKSGEYVFIIGNNGTGKSSLIKSILGLVPASRGQVFLNCDKDKISYVPQANSIPTNFPATAEEIVISGTQKSSKHFPFYSRKDRIDADSAIELVDMAKFKKHHLSELSGGQQQKILLARALCKHPHLLVLDEPCSGLDESSSENFYQILKKLNLEQKVTILMVSHDTLNIQKYASRIIKLNKKIVSDNPANLYFEKGNKDTL